MSTAPNPIALAAQRLAGVHPASSSAAPHSPREEASTAAPQANNAAQTTSPALAVLVSDLKRRCARKALLGAGSSLIPLPFIDLAVDAVLLAKMFNQVHEAFGFLPAQIEALDAGKRHRTYAAIQFVGNRMIGQFVTRAVVTSLVKGLGVKLTAQQLSKAVPIAGQIASAALNYATLRLLINKHIDDCASVAQRSAV